MEHEPGAAQGNGESPSLEVFKTCVGGHLGTWFNGGLASAGLMLGSDGHKGLFQPKRFYDSLVKLCLLLSRYQYILV